MTQGLFNLKEYGIIAFQSTSQALKAERVLKEASAQFLVIPTPRQISASCGLAVKVAPENLDAVRAALEEKMVRIEGVYHIINADGASHQEKLDND
ncbi:MAG: DUF3343 domain-containing protein [Syntrophomonadaceae bacterium]